ncbi:MAG: T9SS type A sorting domain-containing protein, partial [Flavobacteriales bacterium]
ARKVLNKGSEKVGGYDYSTIKEDGGWSEELGYGRINAYNSLVYGATSVNENASNLNLHVETYTDRHIIKIQNNLKLNFSLLDINGRLIQSGTNASLLTVSHSGLSAGIYALQLADEKTQKVIKLVIP